jgi:hypothetical protein
LSADDLRFLLLTLSLTAWDKLRRAVIHDQPGRDAIATQRLRYCDANGDGWADVIDFLTLHPDAGHMVVRLAEIDAARASATPSRRTSCR